MYLLNFIILYTVKLLDSLPPFVQYDIGINWFDNKLRETEKGKDFWSSKYCGDISKVTKLSRSSVMWFLLYMVHLYKYFLQSP